MSLLTFGVTTFSGVMEGIPWTYRIPAALVAACAAVWLWRHLTLQRQQSQLVVGVRMSSRKSQLFWDIAWLPICLGAVLVAAWVLGHV